jgi:hypothetical protein
MSFTSLTKYFINFLCIYIICSLCQLNAQVFIEKTDGGFGGKPSSYMVYGSGDLSKRLPYDKIKGSPFWSDEYKLAALYSGKNIISTRLIKLNLATNEIYFLKNDEELVLENNDVSKLVFYQGKDTSATAAIFIREVPNLFIRDLKVDDFIQLLNKGKYQLLKYTKRIVGDEDSLFGTQKRYFFKDELHYLVRVDDKIDKIKKLNEEYLLSLLPSASNHKAWIKENKISFKKEEDLIRFLNYYNSQTSSTPIK